MRDGFIILKETKEVLIYVPLSLHLGSPKVILHSSENVTNLLRFLWLTKYLQNIIFNASLRNLTTKDMWMWLTTHEQSVNKLMSRAPARKFYNVNQPLVIQTNCVSKVLNINCKHNFEGHRQYQNGYFKWKSGNHFFHPFHNFYYTQIFGGGGMCRPN